MKYNYKCPMCENEKQLKISNGFPVCECGAEMYRDYSSKDYNDVLFYARKGNNRNKGDEK